MAGAVSSSAAAAARLWGVRVLARRRLLSSGRGWVPRSGPEWAMRLGCGAIGSEKAVSSVSGDNGIQALASPDGHRVKLTTA